MGDGADPRVGRGRHGGRWRRAAFGVDPGEDRAEQRDLGAEVGQGKEGDDHAGGAIHGGAAEVRGISGEADLDHLEGHSRQQRTGQHRPPGQDAARADRVQHREYEHGDQEGCTGIDQREQEDDRSR